MARILIVGGGYAGTTLARALDAVAEVVLIEPREAFVHNVAAIRAIVDPSITDRIILPYDRLLKRGKVVRGRVTGIADTGIILADGSSLTGDVIVLATGSTYAAPFKPAGDDMTSFRAALDAEHQRLAAAQSVAIIGAGAVGTELAGEIAAGTAGKRVTLISATPQLFPGFAAGLGERLARDLRAMGVDLRTGVSAQGHNPAMTSGSLSLSDGSSLTADLIIAATGARPASGLAAAIAGCSLDANGRIAVDSWLRVGGRSNLFALGDVASAGDMMTIVAVSRQAPWLAKTIKALLAGKAIESQKPYAPWKTPPILIPIGPKSGASVLPLTPGGTVVGPLLTSAIKGKSLFIPRYRKEFGGS